MKQVQLRPSIQFGGDNQPTAEQLTAMHQEAHQRCFIANSVKTSVRIEPRSE
jgi:organic hydroperoxide reductase OsmC/OhrA